MGAKAKKPVAAPVKVASAHTAAAAVAVAETVMTRDPSDANFLSETLITKHVKIL